jgi:hypothetical protein
MSWCSGVTLSLRVALQDGGAGAGVDSSSSDSDVGASPVAQVGVCCSAPRCRFRESSEQLHGRSCGDAACQLFTAKRLRGVVVCALLRSQCLLLAAGCARRLRGVVAA